MDSEMLWDAANDNDIAETERLFKLPEIDVNWKHSGADQTALHVACREDNIEIVKMLLLHPDIDVNITDKRGQTPFLIACYQGRTEVVKELLKDGRIDFNKRDHEGGFPLYWAIQDGYLDVVKHLLASGRPIKIDVKMKGKTSLEVARLNQDKKKGECETQKDFIMRKQNLPNVINLLESYEKSPINTTAFLLKEFKIQDTLSSNTFALVVFFCDGYLQINPSILTTTCNPASGRIQDELIYQACQNAIRFFRLVGQLPFELQMVLCNRLVGSPKNFILSKHSEPAFKRLADLLL